MTVFEKIRIWGIKGAFDFLFARLREWRITSFFRHNAEMHPHDHPELGITIVGTLSNPGSLN